MRFQHCPQCGCKLELRPIGDEGDTPFCPECSRPWFDMFSTCAIVLVVDEENEALLLNQNYITSQYSTLVSGYMKPGETASDTARREVLEEVGLPLDELQLVDTYWYAPSGILMVGFFARAKRADLKLSVEVDGAGWVPLSRALGMVYPKEQNSVAYLLLERYIKEHLQYAREKE